MFACNIKVSTKYDYLSEKFKAGYKWLAETDIKALADGAYPILGDDVIANVQSYETEPFETRKFEAHDKYFDIQYMVSGSEFFGVCHREGLKVCEAHPEKDLYFFDEPEFSGQVLLREGDFKILVDASHPYAENVSANAIGTIKFKVKSL